MKRLCLHGIAAALLAFASTAWGDAPSAPPPGAAVGDGAAVGRGAAVERGTQARVGLGDAAAVSTLFSWPNSNGGQTRAQTAAHYLRQSLARDGLNDAAVRVEAEGGRYYAILDHAPADYAQRITQFLAAGARGAAATAALRKAGKWNAQQWRFFLPLGLALENQKSVQLLHFPPDYSLTGQDYLDSRTSRRWETLLELNGAQAADVSLYERIVDIAPIAAPADAGGTLGGTYAAYKDYAYAMLSYSIAAPGAHKPLPVVAYGAPVRDWVKNNLGVTLRVSAAPVYAQVGGSARIPMLGANHPSLFWYVAQDSRTAAARVMRDDLVAACWQVRMGNDPGRRIRRTLKQCAAYWNARPVEVCEQTEIQGYGKTAAAARRLCARSARRLMRAARALRASDLLRFERYPPGRAGLGRGRQEGISRFRGVRPSLAGTS